MADDTRQSSQSPTAAPEDLSREALNVHPENKAFSGSQWQDGKAKPYGPPENANVMAGGTEHTAGGKVPEVTFWNAFTHGTSIWELHKRPCVRDALMTGIGAGFAVGGIRAVFGASVWRASNWAVGTFVGGSGGMYQYCVWKRQAEKEGMMRAVEILNKKEIEKKAREQRKEKLREERRQAKDKEQDAQLAALNMAQSTREPGEKPWWKVW